MIGRCPALLLLFSVYLLPLLTAQSPVHLAREGLVVIEAEAVPAAGDWRLDTAISDYTGTGYLDFQGTNQFNIPGTSLLQYRVWVATPGTYRFRWRSLITAGDSNTHNNDCWLRISGAADFYAERDGSVVYPKGSGKTPVPDGAGSDGWFKVYQNVRADWTWNTTTFDNQPHDIYAVFDTAGTYTVEVSGRSRNHAIDRLVLHLSTITDAIATDTATPASDTAVATSLGRYRPTPRRLELYPNPVHDRVLVGTPVNIGNTPATLKVYDAVGRLVRKLETAAPLTAVATNNLDAGRYFIELTSAVHSTRAIGSFLKR